jgi:hypothetical protein
MQGVIRLRQRLGGRLSRFESAVINEHSIAKYLRGTTSGFVNAQPDRSRQVDDLLR